MKIFITGIGGYLGRALAQSLAARGHEVTGSARAQGSIEGVARIYLMSLGENFDAACFEAVDAVIHAAHDFSPDARERNIKGTLTWVEAAAQRGVKQQIFVSSASAQVNATSEYGRIKYELQQRFLKMDYAVVRPGLVIGNGGLFAKQRAAILRYPFVPTIGRGSQPTAVVGLPHFVEAVAVILKSDMRGVFDLAYLPQPTYRELVAAVREDSGLKVRLISIPYGLALAFATALRPLGLPVHPDQIRALAANAAEPVRPDLQRLLPNATDTFTLRWAFHQMHRPPNS